MRNTRNTRKPRKNNSNQNRRKGLKKKRVDPKKFWGDPSLVEALEQSAKKIQITSQPDAVIRSLGRPPLSVPQHVTELHFSNLYERSVMLAAALAAAGDLIENEDLS